MGFEPSVVISNSGNCLTWQGYWMNRGRTFGSVLCVGEQQVKSDLFHLPFCSVSCAV